MRERDLTIGNTYQSVKFNMPVILTAEDIRELVVMAEGASIESYIKEVFEPLEIRHNIKELGLSNMDYGYDISIDLDKTLRLIVSDGWFYPQIEEMPETANGEIQVVSLNRIKYVHELQYLYFMLKGENLIYVL